MEKERLLPEPHRYAICSPGRYPVKKFYKGVFQEVFIFFHPFIKPKNLSYDLFNPDKYPDKNEIQRDCKRISWEQFLGLSGIESPARLDIGLRTSIGGIGRERACERTAEIIQETCERERMIPPYEGSLPEILINDLLQAVIEEGHDWIWYGDEFCTKRELEYIEDLIEKADSFGVSPINLFTHDQSLLITTGWDSHFSLLCSDKETVARIVKRCSLEGFYCGEDTWLYWSVQE
ncbi:DUF2711 family protein [Peribacillus sp. SCS-26]|uniref:DUF2711 family protein n=1 Tax=Paraperibacillus marinus TaxID=3115295 RepID=UPI0039062424